MSNPRPLPSHWLRCRRYPPTWRHDGQEREPAGHADPSRSGNLSRRSSTPERSAKARRLKAPRPSARCSSYMARAGARGSTGGRPVHGGLVRLGRLYYRRRERSAPAGPAKPVRTAPDDAIAVVLLLPSVLEVQLSKTVRRRCGCRSDIKEIGRGADNYREVN